MSGINLIPKSRLEAQAERRRVRVWLCLVGVYALSAAVACITLRLTSAPPGGKFEAESQSIAERIAQANKAARAVQAELAVLRRQLDAATTVGRHADWSLLLSALARVRGEDVLLDTVEVSPTRADSVGAAKPDPAARAGQKSPGKDAASLTPLTRPLRSYAVKLTGFARSPGKVFGFAHDLESLGPLEGVTIVQTRAVRLGSLDTTGFELGAMISEQSQPETGGPGRAAAQQGGNGP